MSTFELNFSESRDVGIYRMIHQRIINFKYNQTKPTMKSILSFFTILLFCYFPFLGISQNEQERILNFEVEIKMNEDRSIDVFERIEVYATGDQIKRGITRGLPIRRYIENQKYIVKYENISIKRNGKKEAFHSRKVLDGKMLYLGKQDVFLTEGKHVYEIRYSVPNQTEWLDESDRLRWNAIGTDVAFPTDKAHVTVTMPQKATLQYAKTYVGEFGSAGNQNRIFRSLEEQSIQFSIDEGLKSGEGVTVSILLDKGAILKPTLMEKQGSLISILISSALLFFYFIFTWFRYGRDPETSESALLYSTPKQLSPASINYIRAGRYKARSMTSSIIALAVKGFIKIDGDVSRVENYAVHKLKDATNELPPEELMLMKHLFSARPTFILDGEYDSKIVAMKQAHEKAVKDQHQNFVEEGNNLNFVVFAIFIVILTIATSLVLSFVFGLGSLAVWKQLLIFVPIAIIGLVVYRKLIVQPTVEKVNLLSEIEGFKKYIELNKMDRDNLDGAPGISVEHFESVLPHAFALGLEKNWFGTFEDFMSKAFYKPNWTSGSYRSGILFHSHFNGHVQSASVMPTPEGSGGFSSGSSGGGFSGGGGGGGSVGGW